MDPRISFVTLAVADPARSRRFYVDGLGWPVAFEAEDVVMIRCGPQLVLSLWSQAGFVAEVGPLRTGPGAPGVTLAHNLASPSEVDSVLAQAGAAGAGEVRPGVPREWGGYSGYFTDPDGYFWEVAHNPSPLGESLLP